MATTVQALIAELQNIKDQQTPIRITIEARPPGYAVKPGTYEITSVGLDSPGQASIHCLGDAPDQENK